MRSFSPDASVPAGRCTLEGWEQETRALTVHLEAASTLHAMHRIVPEVAYARISLRAIRRNTGYVRNRTSLFCSFRVCDITGHRLFSMSDSDQALAGSNCLRSRVFTAYRQTRWPPCLSGGRKSVWCLIFAHPFVYLESHFPDRSSHHA